VRPELEREIVQRLLWNSVSPFAVSGGKRIQYNKRDLEIALMSAIREAFAMGYQRAKKEQFVSERTGRAAWMDIRLDDSEGLARRQIRIDRRTLKSLRAGGYQCLGDLRWVSEVELRQLHYIGLKSAAGIAQIIRTLENRPENSAERT